ASLAALGVGRLLGKDKPQLFRRTIADESMGKAVSIVMVSAMVVVVATMSLLISELGNVSHALTRGRFFELFFEVVSAFGTVGLSTGITAGLSQAGKVIITLVMFIGRLGPLVIAVAVSRDTAPRYYYAEESMMIG
ncbi:MAG: potassium transporter TrkG, partial [Deltaproteobacteria bacterium]